VDKGTTDEIAKVRVCKVILIDELENRHEGAEKNRLGSVPPQE
jgi:hypothetical protein